MKIVITLLTIQFWLTSSQRLIVYQDGNFRGSSRTLTGPEYNLGHIDFNDEISSIRAIEGDWELYTDVDYEGDRYTVFEGDSVSVRHNDAYSSARPICKYDTDGSEVEMIIFEDSWFRGNSKSLSKDYPNLGYIGFNDEISSVNAVKGNWELYRNTYFEGDRYVIYEGSPRNIPNDRASSARPICTDYKKREKCKLDRVEILDDGMYYPRSQGIKIIGSACGGSCSSSSLYGLPKLLLSHETSTTKTTTLAISKSEEVNWKKSSTVEVGSEVGVLGLKTSVKFSLSVESGGSRSVTRTETTSISAEQSNKFEQELPYSTPGGAIIFGLVEKFQLARDSSPAKLYMKCTNKDDYVKQTTVELDTIYYNSAEFWTLQNTLTKDQCERNNTIHNCVCGIQYKFHGLIKGFNKEKIKEEFDKCFHY